MSHNWTAKRNILKFSKDLKFLIAVAASYKRFNIHDTPPAIWKNRLDCVCHLLWNVESYARLSTFLKWHRLMRSRILWWTTSRRFWSAEKKSSCLLTSQKIFATGWELLIAPQKILYHNLHCLKRLKTLQNLLHQSFMIGVGRLKKEWKLFVLFELTVVI